MNEVPVTREMPHNTLSDAGEMAEAEAIWLAKQGDERGFERIYRLHAGRVYAVCFRMTKGNAAEAEELTQETFLQLFRKISTFRAESALSTWLHRITCNIVLMRMRRHKYQHVSLDEVLAPEENIAEFGKRTAKRDLRLEGTVDRIDLERAIRQLPRGYKAIFMLHDVEGYDHEEIAAMRGCSQGNCKSQLHKARAKLRHLLGKAA